MRPIDADSLKVRLSGCMILMPNGEKCTAKRAIDTQGTIEPEVRRGRWIPVDGEPYAKCSYCGEKHYGCTTPYCDMCGAYMRDADHIADGSKKVGGAENG